MSSLGCSHGHTRLNYLLTQSGGSPEEPPRVMTLFEVVRAIKFIEADDRIVSLEKRCAQGES